MMQGLRLSRDACFAAQQSPSKEVDARIEMLDAGNIGGGARADAQIRGAGMWELSTWYYGMGMGYAAGVHAISGR